MNKELKKFINPILWSLPFLFVILIADLSASFGGTADPKPGDSHSYTILTREADMSKILSVLENRIGSQRLIEKAKDRLFTFSDAQTRLMADLADRIANEGNTAGGDIAFLLITALIILS
jgi:hypothetical protein